MNSIHWPQGYIPGFSDNFASNEMVITGVSVAALWDKLTDTAAWPGYYSNASDIHFHDDTGPRLTNGARFRFTTFGFPVEAEVNEFEPPLAGSAGRIAWHGWCGDDSESRLDVHHAWLIEALPGGRVRLLTQETQNGKPARDLASARPNPMINGHQAWLDGMIAAARTAQQ
ncbi:SRPBCC domain-containing protein [Erwinia rhapontici]|uniref:SRPBCC domain-containing protein n=1 Tax=Erwinia rhapontici TaxID=55212 RepID=UPI001D0DB0B1|nr:SRPBCC domain-containing protein [Erwinia rhapontici]UDQ78762.1 SRPBCC domain-containing protein [Erwinia rhapontici]